MFRWALWKGRAATLVSRATDLVATTAMLLGVGLLAPAAAHASVQSVVSPYTMTPERMLASLAAVVALIGVVIGGLALTRSAGRVGTGNGRRGAIVALVLAPIGAATGGLVVATADGGLGTGNGLGGGIVAMIVGAVGMTLGVLALTRARRTG